jgi:nicotinamide phosphoribosyltransferase
VPKRPLSDRARDSIPPEENLLKPVFRDGKILRLQDFRELIERSER